MDGMNQENQGLAPAEQAQEKQIPQSEVSKIVMRETQAAAAKARQEVEREYQQRMESQNQQRQSPMQQQQQDGQQYSAPQQVDADTLYQQVQERFNREQQLMQEEMRQRQEQAHMSEKANAYYSKLNNGSKAYDDFSDITKDYDATSFPEITYLLADNEKAADIIYYLSQHPEKLVTIDSLAKRVPNMARSALEKIGGSIGNNQEAQQSAQNNQVNAPLDHMQPSRVSGSNGKMSISDLRKDPRFRV